MHGVRMGKNKDYRKRGTGRRVPDDVSRELAKNTATIQAKEDFALTGEGSGSKDIFLPPTDTEIIYFNLERVAWLFSDLIFASLSEEELGLPKSIEKITGVKS